MKSSTALWYQSKQKLAHRTQMLCPVGEREVVVDALYSGVSRGTERLVFEGKIPRSQWGIMRCPHQEGSFPFPVKYGYGFVGRIGDESGQKIGKPVFCLHPHQTSITISSDAAYDLGPDLPAKRAVLAANMETALNVVWDARVSIGDRVLVVGAGVVGLLIGYLMTRIAGVEATVCDVNKDRRGIADALGLTFCTPGDAPEGCDAAINASATADGLTHALASVGPEARVVEASWYGDAGVTLPLGEAFHSQRLKIVSSQVGQVPAERRARWPHRRRMEMAISLLADPRLDHLITHEIEFDAAPDALPALFDDPSALAIVLRYSTASETPSEQGD